MWQRVEMYFLKNRTGAEQRSPFLLFPWEVISDTSFADLWKYVCLFFQWEIILLKIYLFVHITIAPKSSVLLLILPSATYYNCNTEYNVISFTKTLQIECKTRHKWWIGNHRRVQGNNKTVLVTVIGSNHSTESP